MKIPMTAAKSLRYAGRQLVAGDEFEANRRDARILAGIRKATYRTADIAAAPAQKAPAPMPVKEFPKPQPIIVIPSPPATGDLPALRKQYEALFGKRAFHGWDAETLRKKIAAAPAQKGGA